MIAAVADTHTALWYLLGHPRLSVAARAFMDAAAAAGSDILVSSISLAEVVYLVEKKRLLPSAYDDLITALRDPDYVVEEAPFGHAESVARRSPRPTGPHCCCYRSLLRRPRHQQRRPHSFLSGSGVLAGCAGLGDQ